MPWLMFLYVYIGCESTLLTCCWLPLVFPCLTDISSLATVASMFGVCSNDKTYTIVLYYGLIICHH